MWTTGGSAQVGQAAREGENYVRDYGHEDHDEKRDPRQRRLASLARVEFREQKLNLVFALTTVLKVTCKLIFKRKTQ
jgi:hypothetical protein